MDMAQRHLKVELCLHPMLLVGSTAVTCQLEAARGEGKPWGPFQIRTRTADGGGPRVRRLVTTREESHRPAGAQGVTRKKVEARFCRICLVVSRWDIPTSMVPPAWWLAVRRGKHTHVRLRLWLHTAHVLPQLRPSLSLLCALGTGSEGCWHGGCVMRVLCDAASPAKPQASPLRAFLLQAGWMDGWVGDAAVTVSRACLFASSVSRY